jgi:hypothetical protein
MMKRHRIRAAVAAAGLATALGALGATSADARPDFRRHHRDYDRHAWRVVRNDPCLLHEYREFASEHKNPNKRARFVNRLAREGCPDPHYHYPRPEPRGRFWFFFGG